MTKIAISKHFPVGKMGLKLTEKEILKRIIVGTFSEFQISNRFFLSVRFSPGYGSVSGLATDSNMDPTVAGSIY